MALIAILAELKLERDRVNAAIAALEGGSYRRRGRPAKAAPGAGPRRARRMSAEARRKISEAKRKWWAAQKRAKSG